MHRPTIHIFFLFLCCLYLTSCSFYRVTLGSGSAVGTFKSKVLNESNVEVEKEICVKESETINTEKCSGGGMKSYNTKGNLDGMVEMLPSYFGGSSWGWGQFYTYSDITTTLVDYPTNGEETKLEITRVAANPFIFYNVGDKIFQNGQGLSARLGGGLSLSYQFKFTLERSSTNEKLKSSRPFQIGSSAFFELCWNWFTFRSEMSQVYYYGAKFSEISDEQLTLTTGKMGLYYTYYF